MFIGHFTERPYQDPKSGYFGATGLPIKDLTLSNEIYDSQLGADLYNRYLDERVYAEEVGFDGIMLNEHHSTPFCMGGAMNVEASVLARITKRAKIVLLGNILPIWDDPLWLVEQLATIDMISRGRLVSGWVRGTGRESVAHNHFRTVSLGGQTLPVPLRQPVDEALPEAPSAYLAARRCQP